MKRKQQSQPAEETYKQEEKKKSKLGYAVNKTTAWYWLEIWQEMMMGAFRTEANIKRYGETCIKLIANARLKGSRRESAQRNCKCPDFCVCVFASSSTLAIRSALLELVW